MANSQPAPSLPVRPLGRTGLQVTSLCLGAAPLASMPDTFGYAVGEEQALETIRAVFKSPINFVDTAASYGDGRSEALIGTVLNELDGVPDGYIIATKADRDLHTGDFSGAQMRKSVERSLKLLGLDSLPLVYLHDPEHISFEEAMAPHGPVAELQRLKEELLIEHLGVAGGPIDLMSRFVETGIFEVAISHNRYTLLNREADPFWDLCLKHHVAAVNAAPYGSGILAKGPSKYPRYLYAEAPKDYIEKAQKFEALSNRYNVPLAAVALQFSLRDPRISSTIVGMTHPERIEETVRLAHLSIPAELWNEVEDLL